MYSCACVEENGRERAKERGRESEENNKTRKKTQVKGVDGCVCVYVYILSYRVYSTKNVHFQFYKCSYYPKTLEV